MTKGLAQFVRASVDVDTSRPTRIDVQLDHQSLKFPPDASRRCPTTGRGVREDTGASKEDAEAISHAVLERFAEYPNTLTGGLHVRGAVNVVMTVLATHVLLGAAILPSNSRVVFVPRPVDFLAENGRLPWRKRATSLVFGNIDSNGACALVTSTLDHSIATDVYEKRSDAWVFVRRVAEGALD